ncbi:hypothetical protein [Dyadobacter psychrotolerans]|jgi:hypothetical protein|uniref:Uncharacterized protein n=1 Tax=Dyadobacter psychrotolerans TaxID=2541721 RepID=A0A4R5DGH1_9BACT|nr:hypothetical protein [Dyadobacter psychrotolerans]TDE09805.1 hypothetical protein E0F88_29895 [Dyadobacter psychrotolerans]
MLAIVISNSIYIILCFVLFIGYVFAYTSLNGLLSNNQNKLSEKPKAESFNSLKGGRGGSISEADRRNIELAMKGGQEENNEGFMFDENARIGGNLPAEPVEQQIPETVEDPEKKKVLTNQPHPNNSENHLEVGKEQGGQENVGMTDNSEEDEDQIFYAVIHDEDDEDESYPSGLEERFVGDMSTEDLILHNSLKMQMYESDEARTALTQECIQVNNMVNKLEVTTGNRIEIIVSKLLTSRERVIFNLFPQFQYEQAA